MRWSRRTSAVCGAVALTLAAVGLLASCTGTTADPSAASAGASGSASPSPGATSAGNPQLVYSATAAQNKAFFDSVNRKVIAQGGTPGGRVFIDALVTAGFAKKDMQVTPDTTAIGLKADNIQFSVLFNGECLIGQYGNIGYDSTVQPPLGTGDCLAGLTRPIDW